MFTNENRHAALAAETAELTDALYESGDDEAEALCRDAADYAAARARRELGTPPREAPDFATMLAREQFPGGQPSSPDPDDDDYGSR